MVPKQLHLYQCNSPSTGRTPLSDSAKIVCYPLGNRLENAWQPVWFYVWCAQMAVGGRIKPKMHYREVRAFHSHSVFLMGFQGQETKLTYFSKT